MIGKYFQDFTGESSADVSNEHTTLLHLRFDADVARYDDEMERITSQLGRSPTSRERKNVSMSLKLVNWTKITWCAAAFTLAAQLCEAIAGLVVSTRLRGARPKSS